MRSEAATTVSRAKFRRRVASLTIAGALSAMLPSYADLQVNGVGKVEAKPNAAEMSGQVSAEAELVGDAITKFEASKRRVMDALNGLGLEQLDVEAQGLSFTSSAGDAQAQQMAMMRGQTMPDVASKVSVTERLKITLKGLDTMDEKALLGTIVRVLDAGKDAGLNMSAPPMNMVQAQMSRGLPASLAVFKLLNADTLRQQALAAAMKDALSKAEKLATLAGVELGAVTSVSEGPIGDDKDPQMAYIRMFMGSMADDGDDSVFTSTTLSDIPVAVNVTVVFAIK